MTISKERLGELLQGCERPEDMVGDTGLLKELKIKLMARMLGAELTAHLGHEEGKEAPEGLALARQSWLIMIHLRHEVRCDGWISRLDFSTLMNGLSV